MSVPTINPKFRDLIPRMTDSERQQLEDNLVEHGCREPLVVWQGVLLDGHNRLEICQRRKVKFATVAIDLPDESAALDWIYANQLGRRNLTQDQLRLLRGERYLLQKKSQGGDHGNQHTAKSQNDTLPDTATRIGEEHGVSRATIIRDGKLAEQVAQLAETKPEEARAVRDGTKKLKEVLKSNTPPAQESQEGAKRERISSAVPAMGMFIAKGAVTHLQKILPTDSEREQALKHVIGWCKKQLSN